MTLYLARVQKHKLSDAVELQLLAHQQDNSAWAVDHKQELVVTYEGSEESRGRLFLNKGLLVLIELSESQQILRVEEATDWVLNLVGSYLKHGITPAFLQQESERVEQGLQELARQSQERASKDWETQARWEQIQALEESLKHHEEELQHKNKELEKCQQVLVSQHNELEFKNRVIQDMQEKLNALEELKSKNDELN